MDSVNLSSAVLLSPLSLIWTNYTGYSTLGAIFTIVPVTFIMMVIVAGNFIVILAVLKEPRLKRQVQNWFIVSLAVADLLVGLLIMPLTLTYEILSVWPFGMILCELWLALDVLFVTASILNLCVISLDRYWSITRPITYVRKYRTHPKVLLFIAAVWMTAFFISFPPLVGWRPERQPGTCLLSSKIGYVLYSAFGSFHIPVVILLMVYVQIYRITKERTSRQRHCVIDAERTISVAAARHDCVRDRDSRLGGSEGSVSLTIEMNGAERQPRLSRVSGDLQLPPPVLTAEAALLKKQRQLKRKEMRATVILGLIMGAFVGCWAPFFVLYTLSPLGLVVPEVVFDVFFWLGYVNSALNPIVYTVFNMEFRKAFKKLLRIR